MFQARLPLVTVNLVAMILIAGCSESDRVSQIALEASQRQAALDQEMARLNREVVESTKCLIQERGEADREMLMMQDELQKQHQKLDDERREIASQRERESLARPIVENIGAWVICSLPLILCWHLLHGIRQCDESLVSDALLDNLTLPGESFEALGRNPVALVSDASSVP